MPDSEAEPEAQRPAPPEQWAATIREKLAERGLAGRPVRYEVVGQGGPRPASWPEAEAWLADAARLGSLAYGFAVLEQEPGVATVLFSRMRGGRAGGSPAAA